MSHQILNIYFSTYAIPGVFILFFALIALITALFLLIAGQRKDSLNTFFIFVVLLIIGGSVCSIK
jgi:membrane protein implicated in regulation of membrane protease activity